MILTGDLAIVCAALKGQEGEGDPALAALLATKGRGRLNYLLNELAGLGCYDTQTGKLTAAGAAADCGETKKETVEDGGIQGS